MFIYSATTKLKDFYDVSTLVLQIIIRNFQIQNRKAKDVDTSKESFIRC